MRWGWGERNELHSRRFLFWGNFDKEITKRCFPGLLCGSDELGKHDKPQNNKDKAVATGTWPRIDGADL